MLKRKLVKKVLGSSLLLAFVIINTAGLPLIATPEKNSSADSAGQYISFDPIQLKVYGLHESEMADMPTLQLDKSVGKYVEDYIKAYSHTFEKIKERSPSYFRIIDSVFTKYGLPVELKYVAIVESQLKPSIVSKAGAVGAWQLMPATARTFSLKVTAGYDERTNFYKSTVAAAKYFRYLHNMLGDWLLVIAAYNGGPGTVFKAIKKSGSRSFWKLQDYLPAESRVHVKKFISTHYYFEKKGSVTTITKDEAEKYAEQLCEFVAWKNALRNEKNNESKGVVARISANAEVILNNDEE
jgi:membrane-bound lytic murein transglycosylase D